MHRILLKCVVAVVSLTVPTSGLRASDQPNIVFFLIDDLGYADCGFNGGTDIQTPMIDALAAAGTVLEALYVQPVCSPTRAALMTGRYATHTGVYTVVRPHAPWGLPLHERTLASALQEASYETAIVGKWHLGEFEASYRPTARGFEHQYGHYFGMIDNFTHLRQDSHDWYRDDQELHEEGYSTHLLTREACRLIESRDTTRPLFLYVPYNAVHAPLQVPERYLEPYPSLQGPRRNLAGMLSAVDEGIGQIVAALESAGIRDKTLIVFSADNGGPRPGSNTPLRGFKGSLFEGGVRGCGFVNWPGRIPAGVRSAEPMHTVDWYPTLITLAGGSLDQPLPIDGRNVWPMLTSGASSPHDAILCVQSPEDAAVRMGDWKLMVRTNEAGAGAGEQDAAGSQQSRNTGRNASNGRRKKTAPVGTEILLFNLADDPGEEHNLAQLHPERVASMHQRLTEFLADAVEPRHSGLQP